MSEFKSYAPRKISLRSRTRISIIRQACIQTALNVVKFKCMWEVCEGEKERYEIGVTISRNLMQFIWEIVPTCEW